MSIQRIFSELSSRKFKFIVDNIAYELPHLNSMKKQIRDLAEEVEDNPNKTYMEVAWFLFEASGNEQWAKKSRAIPMRQAKKIFKAWCEWSGFELPKVLKVYEMIGLFPNAFEADLFEINLDFEKYFNLPIRTQINIYNMISSEEHTFFFAEYNGYQYRWSRQLELQAAHIETTIVAAGLPKNAKRPHLPRPYDNANIYSNLPDVQQDEIESKLPKLF